MKQQKFQSWDAFNPEEWKPSEDAQEDEECQFI